MILVGTEQEEHVLLTLLTTVSFISRMLFDIVGTEWMSGLMERVSIIETINNFPFVITDVLI